MDLTIFNKVNEDFLEHNWFSKQNFDLFKTRSIIESIDSFEEEIKHDENSRHIYLRGIFYGYKPCCIKALVLRSMGLHSGRIPSPTNTLFTGTGHIPCEMCNEHIRTPEDVKRTILEINRNRFSPLNFSKNKGLPKSDIEIKFNLFSEQTYSYLMRAK